MKRALFTFLFVMLAVCGSWAQQISQDNLIYQIVPPRDQFILKVVGYEVEPVGTLTIPGTIKNEANIITYRVISVGKSVFRNCSSITKLMFESHMSDLQDSAFYGCSSIDTIICDGIKPPVVNESVFGLVDHSIPVIVPAEAVESYRAAEGWKDFTNLGADTVMFVVDNLKYRVTNEAERNVELIGYEVKPTGSLVIPEKVRYDYTDYHVTSIGSEAFGFCDDLTEVIVSQSVKHIGTEAFYSCIGLQKLTIGENVTSIGAAAFCEAPSLSEICVLASEPPVLDSHVFLGVDHDIPVYVPINTLDKYLNASGWMDFNNLQVRAFTVGNLKYVVTSEISKDVEVNDYVNQPKGELTIPSEVEHDGISYEVSSIGEGVFANCFDITELVFLGDNLLKIGSLAFSECTSLEQITIYAHSSPMGSEDAFEGVNHNIPVYVPGASLSSYERSSLWNKFDLQPMLEESFVVDEIEYHLIDRSSRSVEVVGAMVALTGEWVIPDTVISEGVTYRVSSVGSSAFSGNDKLTGLVIGRNVDSIGANAFKGCTALSEMTVSAMVPPTVGTGAFDGVGRKIPVYVPARSLDGYKAAGTWKEFVNLQLDKDYETGFTTPDGLIYNVTDRVNKAVILIDWVYTPEGLLHILDTVWYEGVDFSVTGIGQSAFVSCDRIRQLVIGRNVDSIGANAFKGCTGLSEMTVLASEPPTAGADAFEGVDHDIPVYVPAVALYDYRTADTWKEFKNLQAEPVAADEFTVNNLKYKVTDKSVKTVSVVDFVNTPKDELVIRDTVSYKGMLYTVTGIGQSAFIGCNKIKQLVISGKVASIGANAFKGCTALSEMTVSAMVPPAVGTGAFDGVGRNIPVYVPSASIHLYQVADTWKEFSQFQKIISDEFTFLGLHYKVIDRVAKTVKLVGYQYDYQPAGKLEILATVKHPEDFEADYTVTTIGEDVFNTCDLIKEVVLPASLTKIENGAFRSCESLEKINIPEGITHMGDQVFNNCSELSEIVIPNSLKSMGVEVFGNCFDAVKLTIGNGLTAIPEGTFVGCVSLKQVTIPDNVTSIGFSAFYSCDGIEELTIGSGVNSIGDMAFYFCDSVRKMTVLAINPPSVGKDAFYGIGRGIPVFVPKGSIDIYRKADTWKEFSDFQSADAESIIVDNLKYEIVDESARNLKVTGYVTEPIGKLEIPATVQYDGLGYTVVAIGGKVFSNCGNISQVILPADLMSIGDSAFFACTSLQKVNIPSNVIFMGFGAFESCTSLSEITLPGSLKTVGKGVFKSCTNLVKLTIDDGVLSIPESMFYGCVRLKQVTVPSSVSNIYNFSFFGCDSLEVLTIGSGVIGIGKEAFSGCSALEMMKVYAIIPPALGIDAFKGVSRDIPVYVREESVDKYKSAANGWKEFTNIQAFASGTFTVGNLKYIIIDESAKKVEVKGYVTDPKGVLTIPSTVTNEGITYSVTSIANSAFNGCNAITKVTMGESLTNIGSLAFAGCTSLLQMTVSPSVPPTVGADAFEGVSRDIPVFVPAKSLEVYKGADPWKEFNLKAIRPSGVQTPSMPESIRMQDGMLQNPQGFPVSIYDILGRRVYHGTAVTISQPSGVYVVRCAGASIKVVF